MSLFRIKVILARAARFVIARPNPTVADARGVTLTLTLAPLSPAGSGGSLIIRGGFVTALLPPT